MPRFLKLRDRRARELARLLVALDRAKAEPVPRLTPRTRSAEGK